ncbi:serine/threonine-protein kinase [Limnoglobus roseus]|uniref:Serine/threonine protein kinase n=1 Tax=Limnoglobus roseus TaxID=2598579 RepID=A0A5C1AH74_9BACT|nr:serine/threonine-protein kinase [Limnoglobus roseus]QEL18571.1 serine/threonine protein kinase [Limnoglobus roseus]
MTEDVDSGTQAATPDQNRRSAQISSAPAVDPPPRAGERYELQEPIARGGVGAVYRAWDAVLHRSVAVKMMHDAYRTDANAQRRFEYEARITAQLQHPGIPPVHDLGTASNGCLFLALKLIRGQTLDALLKARSSPAADHPRLVAAFEAVCQAIGYAHSQGVLHRDLKPLNVMVGAFGEVQVMDWGLAKFRSDAGDVPVDPDGAFRDPRAADDGGTLADMIMGTPAFMPPEQARGDATNVTERSDVFGLGGILCSILTGRPPFVGVDVQSTHEQAARGAVRPAFDRLDACGADPALVRLAKQCLAVDPTDRPANASVVAAEVAEWRADTALRVHRAEVAAAAADTRRRVTTRAAALVVAVLAGGGAVAAWQAVRATHAQDRAEIGEREAKEANELAQGRLVQLEFTNETLYGMIAGLDPQKAKEAGTSLEKILTERVIAAVKQFEAKAFTHPSMVAQFQDGLGQTLMHLGEVHEALALFEKSHRTCLAALGPNHDLTHRAANSLAGGYQAVHQFDKAIPLLEAKLAAWKAKYGPTHEFTLRAMSNLATAYRLTEQNDKALPLLEEAAQRREAANGPADAEALSYRFNLALAHQTAGRPDKAVPLLEAVLAARTVAAGADHLDTLGTATALGKAYVAVRRPDRGLPLLEDTLRRAVRVLGAGHPNTLVARSAVATTLGTVGQKAAALPLFEENARLLLAKYGPDHDDTLGAQFNLAQTYLDLGQPAKAIPVYAAALPGLRLKFGNEHPMTLGCIVGLAGSYTDTKRGEPAVPLFTEYLAVRRKTVKPNDPAFALALSQIAADLHGAGQFTAAEKLLRECVAIREAVEPDGWATFDAKAQLGETLLAQRLYTQAEPLLSAGYDGLVRHRTDLPKAAAGRPAEVAHALATLYAADRGSPATGSNEVAPPPRAKD